MQTDTISMMFIKTKLMGRNLKIFNVLYEKSVEQ